MNDKISSRSLVEDAVALNNEGVSFQEAGQLEQAIDRFKQAVVLVPNYVEAQYNLGNVFYIDGQLTEAEVAYQKALDYKPDFAELYNNLGGVLTCLGRFAEAIGCYCQALSLQADFVDASNNLYKVIEATTLKLEQLTPDMLALSESCFELGKTLQEGGDAGQAIAAYQKTLLLKPDHLLASCQIGDSYLNQKKPGLALIFYRYAQYLKHEDAKFYNNFAVALKECGREEEAVVLFRQAIALQPDYFKAFSNMAKTLQNMKWFSEAEKCYLQCLQLKPDCLDSKRQLGKVYQSQGKSEQAIRCYRDVLTKEPDNYAAHTYLLFAMSTVPDYDVKTQQAERRAWAEKHADKYLNTIQAYSNTPDPERRLRIGYVSGDFRIHAVASIIAPAIRCFDSEQFDVVCYSSVQRDDIVTSIFKQSATFWRSTLGLSDDEVAAQIREDQIDILVDLSGFTSDCRLLLFARKPAPIQISAWGDGTGTGLKTMDYIFNDVVSIPAEELQYYTEEIIYLPCRLAYMPLLGIPDVSTLPALNNGTITFGCLNKMMKISDQALALWAEILHALPSARLLLKNAELDDEDGKATICERFSSLGIESERLLLLGRTSTEEHMRAYQQVDIALDPLPYGGGTSTLEALWMGCPVITLYGNTSESRATAAILTATGLSDYIANDNAQYQAIALRTAADLTQLNELRLGMRQQLATTPVFDPKQYVGLVEKAYRTMWQSWCEQQNNPTHKHAVG